MTQPDRIASVYWLYDDHCVCPWRHGYVGYSEHLLVRIASHRRGPGSGGARSLPADFKVQVLFVGAPADAYETEHRLRPHPGIGWNIAKGGQKSCLGYKHSDAFRKLKAKEAAGRFKGVPKSPEQREKMRQAALARYADPKERERTQQAVKKALETIDRSGANNHRYGVQMSDETKEKIRQRALERDMGGTNNPNYRHGRYT